MFCLIPVRPYMHICMSRDVKLWPQRAAVWFVVCTVYNVCIWMMCACPRAAVLVCICFSSLRTWLRWSAPLYMPASASGLVRLAQGLQWSKMQKNIRRTCWEAKNMFSQMKMMQRFPCKIFASIIISWNNLKCISLFIFPPTNSSYLFISYKSIFDNIQLCSNRL